MKFLSFLLILTSVTINQQEFTNRGVSLDKAIYNESSYQIIPANFQNRTSLDSIYIPFMQDSIKVLKEDAWGLLELILIEVEYKGYPFLQRIQESKFLRLPPSIIYQIHKIMKERHEN